jgi:hypothetical protein
VTTNEEMEKSFVVRIRKDQYCHSVGLIGSWFCIYVKQHDSPVITTCGTMADAKFVKEPVDCPRCLEKESR